MLRRIGFGWAALEFPSAAVLLVEKPHLGALVVVTGLSFLAQKRFIRKPGRLVRLKQAGSTAD